MHACIVQKVKDLKAVLKKPAPMWALLILLAVTLSSTIVSAQILMMTTFATISGATYTITGEAKVTKIEIKVGKTDTFVLEVTVKNMLTEEAKFDVRVVYEDTDLGTQPTGPLATDATTALDFDTGLIDLPGTSAATVYVTRTA